jgi:hypothetical protein
MSPPRNDIRIINNPEESEIAPEGEIGGADRSGELAAESTEERSISPRE